MAPTATNETQECQVPAPWGCTLWPLRADEASGDIKGRGRLRCYLRCQQTLLVLLLVMLLSVAGSSNQTRAKGRPGYWCGLGNNNNFRISLLLVASATSNQTSASTRGRLRFLCGWMNITKSIFAPVTRCWLLPLEEGSSTSAVEGTPLISSPGTSLQPSPTGKNRNGGKQKYHPVTTDCQRISFYSLCHLPPHITATQRNFAEIARSPPKPSAPSSVSTNQSMSHLKSISKCHQTPLFCGTDNDDDGYYNDDIHIMMSVCLSRKSSLPPGSFLWPPELPITTLYNSRLVLMALDWFFMVPFRFL